MPEVTARTEEREPFVPYADMENASSDLKRHLDSYAERMGYLPNAVKFYAHRPHILKQVMRTNNAIMRHPQNVLSEEFKYRLSFIISRNHGCRYCCAHHADTLRIKFGYSDEELLDILKLLHPRDERERVAWNFVHAGSLGPEHTHDEHRSDLATVFSPGEVVEIACTLGFWSMFNRVHTCSDMPIEEHLLKDSEWVDVTVDQEGTR